MKKLRGFTLIELLIVVAIIAILAAIAVPNFLEAQVRAKVSRVRSDLRSISVAIESYSVDYNQYPMSMSQAGTGAKPGCTVNGTLTVQSGAKSSAKNRWTFATMAMRTNTNDRLMTLTTPIAFIAGLPTDSFADTKGTVYGYANALDQAWILWSYGPDTDEQSHVLGGQLDQLVESLATENENWRWKGPDQVFGAQVQNPTESLYTGVSSSVFNVSSGTGTAFTYDPSNGSVSDGEVWRCSGTSQ